MPAIFKAPPILEKSPEALLVEAAAAPVAVAAAVVAEEAAVAAPAVFEKLEARLVPNFISAILATPEKVASRGFISNPRPAVATVDRPLIALPALPELVTSAVKPAPSLARPGRLVATKAVIPALTILSPGPKARRVARTAGLNALANTLVKEVNRGMRG